MIELRLAGAEDKIGITVHHHQGGCEGAGAFPDRLPERPQPGQINVRMSQRADPKRGIGGFFGQFGRDGHPGGADLRRRQLL